MILILTYPEDVHFLAVESVFKKKGVQYRSYWFDDFPNNSSLSIELGNHVSSGLLTTSDTTLNLNDITSVWYRHAGTPVSSADKKAVKTYIESESKLFLEYLENQIPHAFWASRFQAMKLANDKLYQLRLASELGFQIPHTVAGNCPDTALKAFKQYPEIIVKALYHKGFSQDLDLWGRIRKLLYNLVNHEIVQRYQHHSTFTHFYSYQEKFFIYTKKFSYAQLKDLSSSLSHCPVIIQNYIPKHFELRITVVGNQVFPCAIYSQEASDSGKVDWRRETDTIRHEAYSLPPEIEYRCLEMVRRFGLEMACIDMIVTPDNEYVFLEINPNGQWLWVQERTGMPIAEAMADLLITRQGLQEQPVLAHTSA